MSYFKSEQPPAESLEKTKLLCMEFAILFENVNCGLVDPMESRIQATNLINQISEQVESFANQEEALIEYLAAKINNNCVGFIIPYCIIKGDYYNEHSLDSIICYARNSDFGVLGTVEDYIEPPLKSSFSLS